MTRLIIFFYPVAKRLDNCLAVNNTTSPSPTKVACRVRGHTVTPAARGTWSLHEEDNEGVEQCSLRGPFPTTKAL